MKSEKDASRVVAKATSRHTYFRNLLSERAAKVAKKGLVDATTVVLAVPSTVVVSSPPAPTIPAAPTTSPAPTIPAAPTIPGHVVGAD